MSKPPSARGNSPADKEQRSKKLQHKLNLIIVPTRAAAEATARIRLWDQ